jgi:hypothetical protein
MVPIVNLMRTSDSRCHVLEYRVRNIPKKMRQQSHIILDSRARNKDFLVVESHEKSHFDLVVI